jgi:hypothetical protein
MIQSNKDLYQEINIIVEILKSSGNDEFAKKIEDALSISTVPSEVLGETRLVLESLNSTKLPEQLNIKNQVENALNYLNKIL